jgi:hypothetical protein
MISDAACDIRASFQAKQSFGKRFQHQVRLAETQQLSDIAETVDIDEDDAQQIFPMCVPLQLHFKRIQQRASIRQACQNVDHAGIMLV